MPGGFNCRSKVKKLLNKALNKSEDHVQSPESRSRLLLKHTTSSEVGDSNPHEATPANAAPGKAQRWSSCSSEPKVGTSHENVLPAEDSDQSQHQPSDSKVSRVGSPHEPTPAVTQHDAWPARGGPGFSETSKLDKALPTDAKPRRDLWGEAEKGLSEDDLRHLSTIDKARAYKVADKVVEQVAELTKPSNPERGKGKVKIAFKSALKSVLTCKDLINSAVECDPTGHAAAAWTLVSFGLQMTQNELDRHQNVLEACELLAGKLRLMAALEDSYRIKFVPYQSDLEDNIVLIYKAILELMARIVFENTSSTGHKILISFNKLEKQPLQKFKEELEKAQNGLRDWTAIIDHQHHLEGRKESCEQLDNILRLLEEDLVTKVTNLESRALTAEEERILDWFSVYPFSNSQLDAASRRDRNTAAWIIESPEYKTWKESGDKLLWLYGKSGCGKSVVCSRIIEELRETCDSVTNRFLAYWYFNFDNQVSLNIDNFISSVIKQICAGTHTLPHKAREHWEKHRSEGPKIVPELLKEILDSLVFGLRDSNKEVFLVLDALDEYPLSGRKEVLVWLPQFCKKHHNVHVLVVSRDETDIREYVGRDMTVDVAEAVAEDVDQFIQSCIVRITNGSDSWKNKYVSQISDRMKGLGERRFRWVALVEQRFLDCIDDEMMEDALENLPETLEGLYADLLKHIRKDYREKARLTLMWLTYSLQPLSLRALASAVSIPNPQKVLEICTSSLVSLQRDNGLSPELDDEHRDIGNDVVKLDHFSVKEYLTSRSILTSEDTACFHADPLMAHLEIAEISVSHLISTNDVSTSYLDNITRVKKMGVPFELLYRAELPLLKYSIMWYKHIQRADAMEASARNPDEQSSELLAKATNLLRDKCHRLLSGKYLGSFKIWLSLFRCDNNSYTFTSSDESSPIYMASLLDLSDNVRRLLDDGANVDGDVESATSKAGSIFTRPVFGAAISGSLKSLRLLLNEGATLDQSGLDVVVKRNSRYEVNVLTTIMEARPGLEVTDSTMIASAANRDSKEVLNYILDSQENLTKSQLEAVAKNYTSCPWGLDVLEKVISYGKEVGCDGNQMLKAFLQRSGCAGPEIPILIDLYDPSYSMGQEVVSWGLQGRRLGFIGAGAILSRYRRAGVKVVFTPDMEIPWKRAEKVDAEWKRELKWVMDCERRKTGWKM